ncbi:MAG: PQQ-binding-like beta-propeller repeat protein, partial [Phycisphaerae bacterium]|nr:PQQ-binding-like beta-propeller repeat protein [Phycisphaerae bacterium]
MRVNRIGRVVLVLTVFACLASEARGGDWPQWRYGPGRGGACPDDLPREMALLWSRQLPPSAPAWPASQYKLQFDAVYEPVVAGKLLFVPSNVSDRVTAYATDSGKEVWRSYTEGPVRFAPVVHKDKVIFASDDGWVYCVAAADGKERWRFRAAPRELRVVGNNRLTSAWPVRGAPVLVKGKVYFAAGIWPFMGIFYYCLDAETGSVVWTNSGQSARWTVHPHGAPSFGSVAPQGYFAVTGADLLVPGGRSTPGVFDLKTGQLRFFNYDKKLGGGHVMAAGRFFFCAGAGYELAKGVQTFGCMPTVVDDGAIYEYIADDSTLAARALKAEMRQVTVIDRKGKKRKIKQLTFIEKWEAEVSGMTGAMIKAGSRIYGPCKGGICAMDVPAKDGATAAWSAKIGGTPRTMLAADGKLFVVTAEGRMYCFGAGVDAREPVHHVTANKALAGDAGPWKQRMAGLVKSVGVNTGYAVVLGVNSGSLVRELLAQSTLELIVIERDAAKADAFRRTLDAAGLYGKRATVVVGDPLDYPLAPYLAGVIVSESPTAVGLTPKTLSKRLLNTLRPYGGTLRLGPIKGDVAAAVEASGVQTLKVETRDKHVVVRRSGSLPGSDIWSHQYGDEANQVVNDDKRVKLPLGVLWFGGPSNDKILPRHGHGPSPQVAGGRLIIEGPDLLRCMDVYTGKVFWQRDLPRVGEYYDYTGHQPGAEAIGSNTVTLDDAVYVVHDRRCLKLDPATGRTVKELTIPTDGAETPAHWGYIGTHGGLLIAGVAPMAIEHGLLNVTRVIRRRDTWRYLAGKHAPKGWTEVDFDDAGWKTGRAGFGYADNDDNTVLNDMPGNYTTVYIRKTFDGSAVKEATDLALVASYDDGFIAYLNGKEVIRRGVAKGRGAEVGKVSEHEAGSFKTFVIKDFQKLIKPGKNLLAIEGHNDEIDGSDFSLDPYLVAGKAGPVAGGDPSSLGRFAGVTGGSQYARGSTRLVVMDRHSGQALWSRDAVYRFRHNGVVAGDGMIFCLDRLDAKSLAAMKRRGLAPKTASTLYALNARTGEVAWKADQEVFGTWLGYAKDHGVLIQAGSMYRDRASDEIGKGIVAYEARTGKIIWRDAKIAYGGPLLIRGKTLITNGSRGLGLDLMTGEETGWKWRRHYGCNTAIAS